jgi:hypothetical protein
VWWGVAVGEDLFGDRALIALEIGESVALSERSTALRRRATEAIAGGRRLRTRSAHLAETAARIRDTIRQHAISPLSGTAGRIRHAGSAS